MKKVVSIALFGSGDKYTRFVSSYVRAHLNLFPIGEGWKLRIHYDDEIMSSSTGDLIRNLAWDGLIEISYQGTAPLTRAMLWRLVPVFDESVDYVFSRDIDAVPMPRDRAVCDQFIASQAAIGTCHDNEMHVGIMGGLCHFKSEAFRAATGFRNLGDVFKFAGDRVWAKHGVDQDVLNKLVRMRPTLVLLEHRYNGWKNGKPGVTNRQAGVYDCLAYSTVTPDVGVSTLTPEAQQMADQLGAHLGCAEYDHERAQQFWDEHGDQNLRCNIELAERAASTL